MNILNVAIGLLLALHGSADAKPLREQLRSDLYTAGPRRFEIALENLRLAPPDDAARSRTGVLWGELRRYIDRQPDVVYFWSEERVQPLLDLLHELYLWDPAAGTKPLIELALRFGSHSLAISEWIFAGEFDQAAARIDRALRGMDNHVALAGLMDLIAWVPDNLDRTVAVRWLQKAIATNDIDLVDEAATAIGSLYRAGIPLETFSSLRQPLVDLLREVDSYREEVGDPESPIINLDVIALCTAHLVGEDDALRALLQRLFARRRSFELTPAASMSWNRAIQLSRGRPYGALDLPVLHRDNLDQILSDFSQIEELPSRVQRTERFRQSAISAAESLTNLDDVDDEDRYLKRLMHGKRPNVFRRQLVESLADNSPGHTIAMRNSRCRQYLLQNGR